jgi:hypothetical protein
VIVLFFMLGWDRYGFDKKRAGTHYAELVFLHPVGFVGHVILSYASWAGNMKELYFTHGWERYGFDKNRTGTHYAELVFVHPVGYGGHVVHFDASGA